MYTKPSILWSAVMVNIKKGQMDRGQYIDDLDTFFKWNDLNAYITTEHAFAPDNDKDRHIKAMQSLNDLVDQILLLENQK